MSPTRLMTYGMFALGAVMIIVGLIYISSGVAIIRMELGWSEVVGGSVAASAGCVVIALGGLAVQMEALRDAMLRAMRGEQQSALPLPVPVPSIEEPALQDEFAPQDEPPLHEEFLPAPVEAPAVHPLAPAARRTSAPVTPVQAEPPLTAVLHPAEFEVEEAPPSAPPAPEPLLTESAPALRHAEDEEVVHGPPVLAPSFGAGPAPEASGVRPRSSFLSTLLARRSSPPAPPPAPPLADVFSSAPPVTTGDEPGSERPAPLSLGWDDEPEQDDGRPLAVSGHEPPPPPVPEPEAVAPVEVAPEPEPQPEPEPVAPPTPAVAEMPAEEPADAEAEALKPVVVGRYNAGSASYVMYSNGMIEVETEQGTHQFASMQDLKAFIEKRDARVM